MLGGHWPPPVSETEAVRVDRALHATSAAGKSDKSKAGTIRRGQTNCISDHAFLQVLDELGLQDKIRFGQPVPVRQIAQIMADADLGIVPKRADSFGNEAYSTKIMEFMSLGVPVVVSSTKIDSFYFNDSVVRFFESGNVEALAEAMLDVLRNPELRKRMVINASQYAAENSWEIRKEDYLELVDALIDNRPIHPSTRKPAKSEPAARVMGDAVLVVE